MTNPIHFLKTKYANIIYDKHFGEIFTGSVKVFGAKVIATFIGLGTGDVVARNYGVEVVDEKELAFIVICYKILN